MKKRVAVVMGSYGREKGVSLRSGAYVMQCLGQSDKYIPYAVQIDRAGWYLVLDEKKYAIDKGTFSVNVSDKVIRFDAIFNAMHGSLGEDGYLQSYLSILQIPHTTTGALGCMLTFSKYHCLAFLNKVGISSAPAVFVHKDMRMTNEEILAKVGLPCIVKPNAEGSSYGITPVFEAPALPTALDAAFECGDELIIETFVKGREFSVGAYLSKGKIRVLPITEIIPDNLFFDYEAKYKGESQEITPADISVALENRIKNLMKKSCHHLNVRGMVRAEFIVTETEEEIYILDVNTVPGLTEASIIPQQVKEAGMDILYFFELLLDEAIETSEYI